MMGHTVDGDLDHPVLLGVILIGLRVEITVTSTCCEVSALIAHSEIYTISLCLLHILILAHPDGIVFRNQITWCILGRNGDEGDHILYLIIIRGEGQGQMSYGIFSTHAKMV